jgi:hypothetical protein
MQWFLLRCNITAQMRYTNFVRDHHPEIQLYIPHYLRITRPHGHRHPITIPTPVYPGYIFAQFDPDTTPMSIITRSPTRAYYVRFNGTIAVVPDQVISKLQYLESQNLLMTEKIVQNPYKPGKKVIIHLPVADIQAIIVKMIGQYHLSVDTNFSRITVPIAKVTVTGS